MIELIEEHYKLIAGIVVPIIIAIIGVFKVRSLIKKNNSIPGDDNNMLVAERDMSNKQSFNTINQNGGALQVVGNNNQVSNLDMKAVQVLAQSFNKTMYPHAERGFEKLRLNSQDFLASFNSQLEQLSQSELEKFSEADVQMALHKAIQGAGRTDSSQVHEILGRLIADRVSKPKRVIAELAINESIEVAAKLDVSLIKILALSFMFSRTKYVNVVTEDILVKKLSLVAAEFKDLEISSSKFEYLESISCGKVLQFTSNDLIDIISKGYPHLFLKKVSKQQVDDLALPMTVQNACFIKQMDDNFKLNSYMGLYLFEDASIQVNGLPFAIEDKAIIERLKTFFNNNRSAEEIKIFLLKISNFESILKIWNQDGFSQFFLTAVGIAIGRAYLEQRNFGNYDINIWIN